MRSTLPVSAIYARRRVRLRAEAYIGSAATGLAVTGRGQPVTRWPPASPSARPSLRLHTRSLTTAFFSADQVSARRLTCPFDNMPRIDQRARQRSRSISAMTSRSPMPPPMISPTPAPVAPVSLPLHRHIRYAAGNFSGAVTAARRSAEALIEAAAQNIAHCSRTKRPTRRCRGQRGFFRPPRRSASAAFLGTAS